MGFEGPKPSTGHEGGIQLRQSWARINELGIAVRTEVAQFVRFTCVQARVQVILHRAT
jgi:hypothetical protein